MPAYQNTPVLLTPDWSPRGLGCRPRPRDRPPDSSYRKTKRSFWLPSTGKGTPRPAAAVPAHSLPVEAVRNFPNNGSYEILLSRLFPAARRTAPPVCGFVRKKPRASPALGFIALCGSYYSAVGSSSQAC